MKPLHQDPPSQDHNEKRFDLLAEVRQKGLPLDQLLSDLRTIRQAFVRREVEPLFTPKGGDP
ncbi:hypothetical protein BSNK01_06960 [Bacillaceae bacterium]